MNEDAKERIYQAASELLHELEVPERITSRQIATRAGVGVGLINYHFRSKDTLMHAVVSDRMMDQALHLQAREGLNPPEKLEAMLIALSDYAVAYEGTMRMALSFELLQGKIQTPLYIMPLLTEIFPDRDEMKLRLTAFQLITSLQAVALRPQQFSDFAGMDVRDKVQRDRLIKNLIQLNLQS